MGARLAFWGDLLLPSELDAIVPTLSRGVLQSFQGVDRDREFYSSWSPNVGLELDVQCVWLPESDFTPKGFRAREAAVHSALANRARTSYPLVRVDSDSPSRTVTNVAGSVITSAAHGLSNSDVVLIRRAGAGLYTLGAIGGVTTNTFTITAQHSIQNADAIYLVSQYWSGCVWAGMSPMAPVEKNDIYCEAVSYTFKCSGSLVYTSTSITLP